MHVCTYVAMRLHIILRTHSMCCRQQRMPANVTGHPCRAADTACMAPSREMDSPNHYFRIREARARFRACAHRVSFCAPLAKARKSHHQPGMRCHLITFCPPFLPNRPRTVSPRPPTRGSFWDLTCCSRYPDKSATHPLRHPARSTPALASDLVSPQATRNTRSHPERGKRHPLSR